MGWVSGGFCGEGHGYGGDSLMRNTGLGEILYSGIRAPGGFCSEGYGCPEDSVVRDAGIGRIP